MILSTSLDATPLKSHVATKGTSDMQTSMTMLLHFQDFFGVLKDKGRFPGLFRPENYKFKIPGHVGTMLLVLVSPAFFHGVTRLINVGDN